MHVCMPRRIVNTRACASTDKVRTSLLWHDRPRNSSAGLSHPRRDVSRRRRRPSHFPPGRTGRVTAIHIYPLLRNCRIVYKVQRVIGERRAGRHARLVKLKSLLSPTNLARDGRARMALSLMSQKTDERNRPRALGWPSRRSRRRSATPFECRYDRTIIIIVTHGFPYSSRTASRRGPDGPRAAVKAGPNGTSRTAAADGPRTRRPRRERRMADRSAVRATIITIVIRRSSAPVVKRPGNFVNAIKIAAGPRYSDEAGKGPIIARGPKLPRSIDSYRYRCVPAEVNAACEKKKTKERESKRKKENKERESEKPRRQKKNSPRNSRYSARKSRRP